MFTDEVMCVVVLFMLGLGLADFLPCSLTGVTLEVSDRRQK